MPMSDYERKQLIRKHYDLGFIARTQPQGNVKIHPGYIQIGTGYGAFLDVYRYPKNGMKAFWLAPVINQDNVIGFLSIGNQSSRPMRHEINKSLQELYSREGDANLTPLDQADAERDQELLFELHNNLRNNSETLKRIFLRLFVYDNDLSKLRHHIEQIKEDLYTFGMSVFIDEQEYDYRSIYLPLPQQERLQNHRKGKVIESYDLGGSYPFDYVNLTDPGGDYLGYTQTSGAFTFNPYNLRGQHRTRVFQLIAGNAGMGKSTLEKMLCDDAFDRNNYVRNFDVTGEYRSMTKAQHGTVIDTSQKGLKVNMFEIFPTVTDAAGNIDVYDSFNQNISKIKTITHIMSPNLTANDMGLLDDCLTGMYIDRGQWSHNPKNNPDKINVLNLPHDQYPTMSEFMEYLDRRRDKITHRANPSPTDVKSIQDLIYAYHHMEVRYSDTLDGHTNVPDLQHEQVITFDLSGTKQASFRLFQAVFFSYLSMVDSQMVMNGQKYRRLQKKMKTLPNGKQVHVWKDDKLGFNTNYYYINIDEAEDYFDVNYPDVVGMIANMMEEMRKNKCAITLAFPTLKDILLNDPNGAPTGNWEKYHQAIRKIFGLMQYFHFFNLPQDDIDALKKFFKRNASVTLEQLDTLNNLSKYEVLTVIMGERSYRWKTELTPDQLDRYQ